MKAEAVTREQYDTISSRIPANGSYIVNTVDGFNIGDIMAPSNIICTKSDDMIVFMTDMLMPLYPQYIAAASITKDLVFDSSIQYTCVQANNGFVHISVGASNNETTKEQGLISLAFGGDGTKALMDDGTYKDICQLDCVKAIKDDISELKMLNSHDYYVAGWVDGNLDPNAVEYHGDKEFANDWDFYLLDTTDNAGETTTPVGKLMRGNLLKLENGDYAPTVGITEEMRSQCDTDLYLDEGVVSLAYGAGAYDAKAEWDIDKALIQSGSSPRALYDRHGQAVSHKLRPWETTETKYTIGV